MQNKIKQTEDQIFQQLSTEHFSLIQPFCKFTFWHKFLFQDLSYIVVFNIFSYNFYEFHHYIYIYITKYILNAHLYVYKCVSVGLYTNPKRYGLKDD